MKLFTKRYSSDLDWQPTPDRAEYFECLPVGTVMDFGGAQAATQAAAVQMQAAQKAANVQLQMFQQSKAGIEPWRLMGLSAMAPYMQMLGLGNIMPYISQAMGPQPTWKGAIPGQKGGAGGAGGGTNAFAMGQGGAGVGVGGPRGQKYQQYQMQLAQWQAEKAMLDKMQAGGTGAMSPTEMLRATPGYGFQVEEGQKALERQASARGLALSGPQEKAMTTFRQGLADQTYQQYLNNLWQTVGSGQGAAAGQGAMGQQAAQGAGQAYMMGGQAAGQGIWNAYQARMSEMGTGLGLGAMGLMGGMMMGLQEGGPAMGGQPYIVGEAGPEVFVPQQSGMVLPNVGGVPGGGMPGGGAGGVPPWLTPYAMGAQFPGGSALNTTGDFALGPFADYFAAVPWAA